MDDKHSVEVVKDCGITKNYSDVDITFDVASHRQQTVLMGLRLPKKPNRPGKHRRHKAVNGEKVAQSSSFFNNPDSLSPSEAVQQIIGDKNDSHKSHSIFCQMNLLYTLGNEHQWREYARWVKYEEDVEEGGERWSKPHVASLSLHSLFELRSSILNGAVMLDVTAQFMSQVVDLALDQLINSKQLEVGLRDDVRAAILCAHIHAHQRRKKSLMPGSESDASMGSRKMSVMRTFSEIGRSFSAIKRNESIPRNMSSGRLQNGDLHESASSSKLNVDFMRKVPPDAEAANVLVGELSCLKYQICVFIRLLEPRNLGELSEVPILSRFVCILLGPPGSEAKNIEIGRSLSTIMVDEVFREVAYKAKNRQGMLHGIDEFLDQVTVLPPGEWDPKIRIEPPEKVPSQQGRMVNKAPAAPGPHTQAKIIEEHEGHGDPTLVRTGRLFGGLINDVKRKIPHFLSDFKDGFHIQCVASVIFMFLATLTPNVTFGGLLGQATDQFMGTMECILTASIMGILYALFSGQPLNILGSTGPMLVMEMILYNFSHEYGWDFLPMRAWTGIWTTVCLLLVVAFDLSALVRYITRFTEESFASLIALIFIYEAFLKLIDITEFAPYNPNPDVPVDYACQCMDPNSTSGMNSSLLNFTTTEMTLTGSAIFGFSTSSVDAYNILNITHNETIINFADIAIDKCVKMGGQLHGPGCYAKHYVSDVFFLSILLFIGTFALANALVAFKTSPYFPSFVRQTVSDFAVLIAILAMVCLDAVIGLGTPKLNVPEKFAPSRPDRPWFINPLSPKNPWWIIPASVLPALLATLLIFMDQQITAVIVNRKENKLKKGNGYHLDLLVVSVGILICSLLGLPFYVAATVSALAHIMSLKKESECTAPGEKPVFLGCREQRLTALIVGILSGLSVFLTSVLKHIPMPVLYGVFLYMGVAALRGMQFVDRVLIIFMPTKYQPDTAYLRYVPIKRVHLFTVIQIFSLAVLWVIKQVKSISIVFPLMVVGTCFVRKLLDWFFTQRELKFLDDIMPDAHTMGKHDEKKNQPEGAEEGEGESLLDEDPHRVIDQKLQLGEKFQHIRVPNNDRVNISEEVNKTSLWLQVHRDSAPLIENGSNRYV
ncbi:hypothetical protein ACJMK2_014085 [Sinanodonta woodiana]|uniref:Anion exchange protein n=1 Tax=Sinanodonta woodiana TaxID=1069815 RepID=A0ABD3V0S8_SINWO